MKLKNQRMNDGSRHFASFPEGWPWSDFRDHIQQLPGTTITGYLTDDVTEVWIDFTYRDYKFSVNNQFGEFWLFVDDPACPDEVLNSIVEHCVLKTRVGEARRVG